MRDQITTTDLSEFGNRELAEAGRLLTAMTDQGLPDDFADDGVTVMFNMHSGYVFLTNSDCHVAMLNDEKLESFYSCPECGAEGFADETDWSSDQYLCGECAWKVMELQDKIDWCVEHNLSIFVARQAEMPA